MINVDDLLKPVAADKPCGEDFTYHPSFQNLETIARGKPETQFSAAEEPQWKEVREAATEVLGQSKHLTAAVILTLSLLKIGGLEGFRDGLALLRGLVEKYWGDVYPRLDPESSNDPTERLNILNNISSAAAPYKFIIHLKQVVLCESPTMGRITLQQLIAAKDRAGKPGSSSSDAAGPDVNQIQAAFRDAGPAPAAATLTLVNELIGHSQGINTFLDNTLGAGRGVSFETLNKLLEEMKQTVEPHASGGEPAAQAAGTEAAPVAGAEAGSRPARVVQGVSGLVQTRADVIKALGLIYTYYRDNEPSSPVPLLLQRAERLVDKDFMAIVTDLTPDAVRQLQVITGKQPE
jgi:type VI secretion system protein ImpA